MAGRRCGTRENRGNGGAAGGAVATGQSGAGWTARNETRGCGEGAKARAGIRAYPNGMGACRLDMNARPAGEILWFARRACRARRAARTEPPAGGGGCVWGRYACRAARTENPRRGRGCTLGAPRRTCRARRARRARAAPVPCPRRARAVPARPLIARPAGEILWFARAALSRTGRTRPRSSSGTPCPQTAGRAARACSPCDRSADPCSGRPQSRTGAARAHTAPACPAGPATPS